MTNEERRQELNNARVLAVAWANKSLELYASNSKDFAHAIMLADTFANLAQALKTGDAHADTPER